MINVIQNSGGRSSAYMTERLLKEGGEYIILFQNTGKENEATLEFLNKCDKRWQQEYSHSIVWLEYASRGFKIVTFETASRKGEPFELMIREQKAIPNGFMRFCTRILKIETANKYLKSLGLSEWISHVGIRFDEPKRWKDISADDSRKFPLVDWRITKADVNSFWKTMPFDLRLKSGNCDLCFLKGVGKKRRIMRDNPEKAEWWIKMEKEIGATFNKDYSYQQLMDGIKKAPEFQFRDDYECDIYCMCNID